MVHLVKQKLIGQSQACPTATSVFSLHLLLDHVDLLDEPKNSGKGPKTKGFGSSDNSKVCLRIPRKKVAGAFDCDLQSLRDSTAGTCDRHERSGD